MNTAIAALACTAAPLTAGDSDFEFWLNPSASWELDSNTDLEVETAQRFRDSRRGRVDTYFARLWIHQGISDAFTLSGAFEKRINDGGRDETRLIQQLSGRHGVLRTRLRFEQRFIEDADRLALRLRPRLGVSVPLDADGRWSFDSNAELFFTLRGTSASSDTGLTGLRTQIGVGYEVNDRLALSATYLRQQDIAPGKPDTIGHAPVIGVELSF
ncbi:DUF2490 domain-containing protein [Erythrobacteraceae bacterium CFH 75059]|nr:DUF2490 domain-containing protein [Erythrobacteraceae bacterium CFH 75059]